MKVPVSFRDTFAGSAVPLPPSPGAKVTVYSGSVTVTWAVYSSLSTVAVTVRVLPAVSFIPRVSRPVPEIWVLVSVLSDTDQVTFASLAAPTRVNCWVLPIWRVTVLGTSTGPVASRTT